MVLSELRVGWTCFSLELASLTGDKLPDKALVKLLVLGDGFNVLSEGHEHKGRLGSEVLGQ